NRAVLLPTTAYMMLIRPFSGLVSAMVRGIRSPVSLARRMTNCPGLAFWAILGALIQLLITVPWAISWRSTISNIATILLASGNIYLPRHYCRPLAEPA